MGIFKKKKNEFEHLHNDNLLIDDDEFVLHAPKKHNEGQAVGSGSAVAPHALTAKEVLNTPTEEIKMDSHPQPDSVYKMMKEREKQHTETAIEDDYVPAWAGITKESVTDTAESKAEAQTAKVTATEDITSSKVEKAEPSVETKAIETKSAEVNTAQPVKTVTAPVVTAPETADEHSTAADSFLERCRLALEKASAEDDENAKNTQNAPEVRNETVEKPVKTETAPEAHSVDDIVRMLRGDSHSDIDGKKPVKTEDISGFELNETAPETAENKEEVKSDDKVGREIKVEVEVIPTDSDSDIMHTSTSVPEPDSDVRVFGKIINGSVVVQTSDGDNLDATQYVNAIKSAKNDRADSMTGEEPTVMIGDLSDLDDLGDAISRQADSDRDDETYYDDDYDDEGYDEQPYYETEDPELSDVQDYKSLDDAANLRVRLTDEKVKNKTVAIFTSVIAVLSLIIAAFPKSVVAASTVSWIELILLASALLMNYDLWGDLKNLFKMRPKFDSLVCIGATVTLVQSLVSCLSDGKILSLGAAAVVILSVNRIAKLLKSSRVLYGLLLIANSEPKRAVVSVGGSNAKVISSGAVDGEALVLCDRKVINVQNYIKNCSYDSPTERKLKVLLIIAAVASLLIGLAVGFLQSAGVGLTVATAILLSILPAATAFTSELPMYFASRNAARYGAMTAGYKGAYELEKANLVAVNSHDLFPKGSVKLYNMKTLSENEIGKTLLDAAAVAIAANSPLSNIFQEIVGTDFEKDLPKVGGFQYEDKMGISGWIGERTVLIGNRNLMQGHSVTVPAASVDQKILKAGYFPVYIAVSGVPCLLFIVKYEPDATVTRELQMLCSTGMTVMVDPNDPNANRDMLCDYFGLPTEALKVMNHNGRVSYERSCADIESASAPAVFSNVCGLFSTITSAITLKGVYPILWALVVIAAVIGSGLAVYLAFAAKLSLLTSLTLGGFQLLFVGIAALVSKIKLHK